MSGHSEIVRDYVELRNYLAQSHPQPNMEFEICFKIKSESLIAFSSQSKVGSEIAKVQPIFFQLYTPHYGVRFESYASDLIKYVNDNYKKNGAPKDPVGRILHLCQEHRKSLKLKSGYEPMS
ncbi:MAG: hypothetical protein JSU04_20445 [Bdellovibrionales bacterium]|nr:hypothetical protein [Bdellovibrionales bacterium]